MFKRKHHFYIGSRLIDTSTDNIIDTSTGY